MVQDTGVWNSVLLVKKNTCPLVSVRLSLLLMPGKNVMRKTTRREWRARRSEVSKEASFNRAHWDTRSVQRGAFVLTLNEGIYLWCAYPSCIPSAQSLWRERRGLRKWLMPYLITLAKKRWNFCLKKNRAWMQVAGSAAACPALLISDENFTVLFLFNLLNSNNKILAM